MWRYMGARRKRWLALMLALCLTGCSGLDNQRREDREEPETVSEWLAQPKPGF